MKNWPVGGFDTDEIAKDVMSEYEPLAEPPRGAAFYIAFWTFWVVVGAGILVCLFALSEVLVWSAWLVTGWRL